MTSQDAFPLAGSPWNPGRATLEGYVAPDRTEPALSDRAVAGCKTARLPTVTVMGTVRDERVAIERCMAVWLRQRLTAFVAVEYLVLDDGSVDGVDGYCRELRERGAPVRYTRWRPPGALGDRSCTALFNAAIRQGLVRSPLVMAQWWDRVPGSFDHLVALVAPHRVHAGVATSATSRHIGASSSVADMLPDRLTGLLALVNWRNHPEQLALVAGPIGSHCVPGNATESSGLCVSVAELVALGGWDERYAAERHGYPNVDLFRRLLGVGVPVLFPAEPVGANYHLSHPAGKRDGKDTSLLADVSAVRNGGPRSPTWGAYTPVELDPPIDNPWANSQITSNERGELRV